MMAVHLVYCLAPVITELNKEACSPKGSLRLRYLAQMMTVHLVYCLAPMMAVHLVRCLAPMMAVHLVCSDDGCALGVLR